MGRAFDVYKNAPGEEETSRPARFPNLCFCLRFLLFVDAVPGKYCALFVWNCFLEQERYNQQSICCNVCIGKAGSPPLLWMGLHGEWLVRLWVENSDQTLWVGGQHLCEQCQLQLCLIHCLSSKTVIWAPLPDFANLSNGRASAEYRMWVSCIVMITVDHRLSTSNFLWSVNWYKPLDPALGHMNTM